MQRHPTARVVNLDKLTYAGNPANLSDLASDVRYAFIQGDVADPSAVDHAMDGCDSVIHFAAESHVDRSITDAAPFLRTNILGTMTLLDAARRRAIERFIHVSTDEVYGEILQGAATETFPLQPRSPYAASKASADLFVQAYRVTHGLPVIMTRSSNNFGAYQFPEKFIPLAITNLLDGEPVPLYGDGLHVRDWLYVDDHCEALLFLLEHGQGGETYNISGDCARSNRDLALGLTRALGMTDDHIRPVPDRPGHDRRYALDGGKLARLGWRPRVPFDAALAQTIAWYRSHRAWWLPLKERLHADAYHWLDRSARPGVMP